MKYKRKHKITPKEAADMMHALSVPSCIEGENYFDQERAHCEADEILCKVLEQQGFVEMVKVFESLPKWYA